MNRQTKRATGVLLLAMAAVSQVAQARAGQSEMEQVRREALDQLHVEAVASLRPRLQSNLEAALADAAPQHLSFDGHSSLGNGRGNAAP